MVKLDDKGLKKGAKEALRACLANIPFLKIRGIRAGVQGVRPDLIAELSLPGGGLDLIVEVKNNGQPRLAREAVNQLLRYREIFPGAYGVFIAPFISSQAAEICAKAGIGYIDLSGNCHLSFGNIYVDQGGKPNLFAKKRDLRSLYSPKAERVLRVLLSNPKRAWKTKSIAAEAKVSLGQISNVKVLLGNREWIKTGPDGFSVSEPNQLLAEWAQNYSYTKHRVRNYYSLKNVAEIETAIAAICEQKDLKYALTGFSGAARYAGAVRYQRASAYIAETDIDLVSLLDFKEVSSGANVSILTPYDEGIFYGATEVDGVQIATPVQIYLDLMGIRGRGEEAATVLLEEVIRPQW